MALQKSGLNARYILIDTVDLEVLEIRLRNRQLNTTNGGDDIQPWLDKARDYDGNIKFDFKIVNDNFENAYMKLKEFALNAYQDDTEKDNSLK